MRHICTFIFIVLTWLLTCEFVNAQYTHPITGQQSTYIGACPVSLCSGTYTDNGGSGNYSANISNIVRTFCAQSPTMQLRASFTSFSMNDTYFLCFGPNNCCDYLQIFDGPTIQSPMIYNNCISSPGTVTSTSGCLTFRFTSDGSVQLAGWNATLSCVAGPGGQPAGSQSDCANATPLWTSGPVTDLSIGPGLVTEGCSDCVVGEYYSTWHSVCVQSSGTLAFTIDPNNNATDYDFAIYGPDVTCGALGVPIRCSAASLSGDGNTGLGNGAVDNSENIGGDQWVAPLNVTTGEKYLVLINRYTNTNPNYNFTFTGTAVLENCSIVNPVTLSCPTVANTAACQTQTDVNLAFMAWLATASGSGGTGGVLTNNSTQAPSSCGGSTTVTFTYTSTTAPLTSTCQATFTVAAPPMVVLTCPTNTSTVAGQTQIQVNQAFATWLATVSGSGGCNGMLSNNNTGAPSASGGATTVTFNYSSSCAPLTTSCQATFTVSGLFQNMQTNMYFMTLQGAINAATPGQTIVLLGNVSESDVNVTQSVIINPNGFTLTIPSGNLTIPTGNSFTLLNSNLVIATGANIVNNGLLINNGIIDYNNTTAWTNAGTYKGTGTFNGNFTNNGLFSPGN